MHLRCEYTNAARLGANITVDLASEAAAQLLCSLQPLLEDRPFPPCRPEKCEQMRELQKHIEALEKHWTARLAHLSVPAVRTRGAQHYYGLCAGTRLEYCLIPTLCSIDRLACTIEALTQAGVVAPQECERIVTEPCERILRTCRALAGETETTAQDTACRTFPDNKR